MKPYQLTVITILFSLLSSLSYAQKGQNEFEKKRNAGELDPATSVSLVQAINTDDASFFSGLSDIFSGAKLQPNANSTTALTATQTAITTKQLNTIQDNVKNVLDKITNGDNVAVIALYRTFTVSAAAPGTPVQFKPDFSSLNVKVFHKKHANEKEFSNYLLATKTVYLLFIDMSDAYYQANPSQMDQRLGASTVKINYRTNRFKQSFSDLKGVWQAMGASQSPQLSITIVEVEPSRIKDPCDIVVSNKSFKNDQTVTIHESNIASFQIGVSNSKLDVQNISLSGGNLTIKPSADQSTSWKSNAYAILETHIPRDIDNFRPLWKSLFTKRPDDSTFNFGNWLYDNTISRIGIYGGAKIAKDPISNLYAGFNYALTSEIGLNFGWTWANTYTNQVVAVGDITSVNDALEYAKRKYSKGKFSIGISFSPSAFSTAVGIKSKSADSGN